MRIRVVRRIALVLIAVIASLELDLGSAASQGVRLGAAAPEVAGERWINSEPLTTPRLRGRVVLVEFWTFG